MRVFAHSSCKWSRPRCSRTMPPQTTPQPAPRPPEVKFLSCPGGGALAPLSVPGPSQGKDTRQRRELTCRPGCAIGQTDPGSVQGQSGKLYPSPLPPKCFARTTSASVPLHVKRGSPVPQTAPNKLEGSPEPIQQGWRVGPGQSQPCAAGKQLSWTPCQTSPWLK